MKSHVYELTRRDWMGLLVPWGVGLLAWTLLLRGSHTLGLLPAPRPASDVDSTILVHQADASGKASGASQLLMGDSSCLMNIDARLLGDLLQRRCQNLGTLSFLDLASAAALLKRYATANPGQPRHVLVVMHPQALRRAMPDPGATQFLADYLKGRYTPFTGTWKARLQAWTGLAHLKATVLDRLVPAPLTGAFRLHYGFTRDLERHMTSHHGSAYDPVERPFRGNAEYRLTAPWQRSSRELRRTTPAHTRLAVALSPIPASFASRNHAETHRQMLRTWATWMGADQVLDTLPPTLPDEAFVSVTHLSREGIGRWTRMVAGALQSSSRTGWATGPDA